MIDSAEQLYLFLLTDMYVLGKNFYKSCFTKMESNVGMVCYYFDSQTDLDTALNLLVCTSWDSEEKQSLLKVRLELTTLLGFDTTLLQNSIEAFYNNNNLPSSKKVSNHGNDDELDSYEALVRDVGY